MKCFINWEHISMLGVLRLVPMLDYICREWVVGRMRGHRDVIRRTVHLLVVEDSPDDVLFLKRALDRMGISCQISFAVNGAEAMDFLSSKLHGGGGDHQEPILPTHVLLDLKLPLKSGLEVLEWIRSQPGLMEIPVVIFTSSQERSDIDQATRLRIDSYRVKPVGFDEYQRVIEEIAKSWKLS
jgi:CheY-like chemotaxis protein